MRALLFGLVLVAGCGGPRLLPTTLFHAPLPQGTEPSNGDWARLGCAHDGSELSIVAMSPVSASEWVVWLANGDHGALLRVRRTEIGLEAQSIGVHAGPSIRPSVRALTIAGTRFVIVESSHAADSTDRDAWLYAEHGAEIVPLSLDGAPGRVRVRAERRSPLDRGWSRVETLTATFEVGDGALVVHEHASVREIADDRPELPARGTYDVERARTLRRASAALISDRPSLFDDAS